MVDKNFNFKEMMASLKKEEKKENIEALTEAKISGLDDEDIKTLVGLVALVNADKKLLNKWSTKPEEQARVKKIWNVLRKML